MTEEYGRNYFYGANKSNYINYEQMNHSKVFGGITHFVRSHGIKGERLQNSLPYPDNHFDCITAVDVLEHTKDFEKNFGKPVMKLKKDGYLVVSTPLNEWPRTCFGFIGGYG